MRRSKLETYIDILKVVREGTHKPTKIMYKANLSWKPLMNNLEFMIKQGLLRKEKDGVHTTYYITDNGKEILGYLDEAMTLVKIQ